VSSRVEARARRRGWRVRAGTRPRRSTRPTSKKDRQTDVIGSPQRGGSGSVAPPRALAARRSTTGTGEPRGHLCSDDVATPDRGGRSPQGAAQCVGAGRHKLLSEVLQLVVSSRRPRRRHAIPSNRRAAGRLRHRGGGSRPAASETVTAPSADAGTCWVGSHIRTCARSSRVTRFDNPWAP